MSVEVVLAIVPICLSALHGISILRTKIRIIQHYNREIRGIRRKVQIQGDNFKNELMRILVESCETRGSSISDWAEYLTHGEPSKVAPEWDSKGEEIEAAIREYLGDKFEQLLECIKEVKSTTDMIYKELSPYDAPDGKDKWRIAKKATRVAFNKSKYMEQIDMLKDSNAEIKVIRETAGLMSKYKSRVAPPPYNSLTGQATPTSPTDCTEVLLRQYKSSRKLLADFLAVLFDQWTLPILVNRQDSGLLSPPLDSYGSFGQVGAMDHDYGRAFKRPRTLPQADSDVQSGLCELFNQASLPISLGNFSLATTRSFDFEGSPEHVDAELTGQSTPLFNLLSLPVYQVVSDRHRLTIALTLVRALLKFHSTKCWPRRCLLSEVKFYSTSDDHDIDLAKCLDTLHISADIDPQPPGDGDVEMENGSKVPSSVEKDRIDWEAHGIQNPLLYSLGVALLQIGLWKQVKWDDLGRVRRKTANLSYLGESYHRMTRKLISGNMGSGESNLVNPKLQEVVMREVVSGLQQLLEVTSRGLP
ncbi:uncharacterized protein DNG_10436 [Cephalotrichum gorgonifer]|uniref:Uncharacterized protein n=1 Tax=Cephalotrichum gorgonifer TaxID=2041049 RepID=A0AAE8T0A8_9PEZI|nr:uncharacterized protein DNG_10436 [Cephalotrichum gorgonifer]